MEKLAYTNRPLNLDEQIAMLKSRGLVIGDEAFAKRQLQIISYFRLASYLRPMESDKQKHTYKQHSTFENAVQLYYFDKELRALIFTAIQSVEIALRAAVIEKVTAKYGAFWFADPSLFSNQKIFTKCMASISQEIARSKEDFVIDHLQKYDSPIYPPVWKTLEIISFGTLSNLYCNLSDNKVKKKVARSLGLPQHIYLESWAKTFTVLRNTCCHHARVWNRRFAFNPQLPTILRERWITVIDPANQNLYPLLCSLIYLGNIIHPFNTFVDDFKALLAEYPNVDVRAMGFPAGWENEPLWR